MSIPTEPLAPILPKNFVRPCLLLMLREHPAHGYDLLERLRAFGFDGSDPGGLYRTLRVLEDAGLVRSRWERSSTGPDRRVYELTRAGMEELHASAKALTAGSEILKTFLTRYSEFVSLRTNTENDPVATADPAAHPEP
jgi:poly-beta-hydroxybutyrate-responsive repressor